MKKMMLATAVLAAGMAMADVSSQVVGYNTTATMNAGQWYIVGLNFQGVNGQPIAINDLLSPSNVGGTLTAGSTDGNSAVIQIRNANGTPVSYFYNAEATIEFDEFYIPTTTPGWTKVGGSGVTTDTIAPGVGFWIKNPGGDAEVTFKK